MKKNGFTLAEVLITLTIIGVVATLTLPALMTNAAEQQAKSALKKGINTLTNAAQMNATQYGYDYASMTDPVPESGLSSDFVDNDFSFGALLLNNANIDQRQTANIVVRGEGNAHDATVYFKDGSALMYTKADVVADDDNTALQADGLPLGIPVVFDTNGAKGPNVLSNCNGKALGENEDSDENFTAIDEDQASACADKAKRVIKDQFTLRLRGAFAQPSGPAATWVMQGEATNAAAGGGQQQQGGNN